jgi:geranylgeranyl diphosphate synthase, type I
VSALTAEGAEADELRALILASASAPQPPVPMEPDDVVRATYLVEACGGREWTKAQAKANLDAALGALERVPLSADPRSDLAELAVFVVERES